MSLDNRVSRYMLEAKRRYYWEEIEIIIGMALLHYPHLTTSKAAKIACKLFNYKMIPALTK